VGGQEHAYAGAVKLGPAGAAKDLHDVQHAEVHEGSLLRIVHLRALHQDTVGGQVHAPRQRGRAAQHAQQTRAEQVLREQAVGAKHARMVDAEPRGEQLLQLAVAAPGHLPLCVGQRVRGGVGRIATRVPVLLNHLRQGFRCGVR
jgi:hypothetical protein